MKRSRLSLDEEILYDECNREWEIQTDKGLTKCRMVKYTALNKKHTVEFYGKNGDKIRVSVDNDVVKKHCWILDLVELSEEGLIDLHQFESLQMDSSWMEKARSASHEAHKNNTVSPYWICGYCRTYVKHSGASLKRLCRQLNVHGKCLSLLSHDERSSLMLHQIHSILPPIGYSDRRKDH